MAENDGILYGVKSLKFSNNQLGYISEDGLAPGGEAPSKTRIFAAQKRDTPIKVLKSNPGTKLWSFTLIQLDAANLVKVMGGSNENGVYTPDSDDVELQGVFDLECVSGHTIRMHNALLTANFANNINMSGVLGVACEIEMMKPEDGGASFTIYPPNAEVPAV
ncbi:hypothetical protein D0T50_09890 [Bacteroides sp. 214]|uniref:hypothetical protein n=1 Tax=Bacteroides sp. 214 TaxID=2302935 RepID=UPI0013D00778|nr:hypothetical protein [Bacteroides sp. 214]NDW13204.1 hypothetical protein [Bacteroides sp. 214]